MMSFETHGFCVVGGKLPEGLVEEVARRLDESRPCRVLEMRNDCRKDCRARSTAINSKTI